MKFDIITIGSASRDVFLSAADFKIVNDDQFMAGRGLCVPLGSKIEIKKIVFDTGGSGTNTAVTFARRGLKTACIGVIGQDLSATVILEELAAENVDTSFFQRHNDDMTAYSVILVDEGGERTILSYKGEGQHFDAAQIKFDEMESDWLMLGSLGGHVDLFDQAAQWAAGHDVKVAANPGTKEIELGLEKLKPLLAECRIVSMNQEEAANLLGIDYQKQAEIFKTMDKIIGGIFVMTRGHDGVAVSDGKQIYRAGVPDSPIIERTGSGDGFISGFVAEYSRSGDISKSIQMGTANASSVVTRYGSKAGILKRGDIGPWPLVEVEVLAL